MNNTEFWNESYRNGFNYRQISDSDLELLLSKMTIKPKTALDVGCGTGDLARQLDNQQIITTAIDLSDEALKLARKYSQPNIRFINFDIENDSISTLGKYDLVTMKLVFKFIKNKSDIIQKIRKLLNNNGYLIVINPVITSFDLAPVKTVNISVDDDMTMHIAKLGFVLIDKIIKPLSDYHNLVSYVFKKESDY